MAIYAPGKRDKSGRLKGASRKIVAALSLTAMVDMFTVLVVFLLQNYNVTGEVIKISDEVSLPNAQAVKELKPANVVVVSVNHVSVNDEKLYKYLDVRERDDWMLPDLYRKVDTLIEEGEAEKKKLGQQIKQAVQGAEEEDIDRHRKITIQADKEVDFLTLKKVMYTLTEAGIEEINFAVIKKSGKEDSESL